VSKGAVGARAGLTSRTSVSARGKARRRSPRARRPRDVREAGIRPAKSLGQHFLQDRAVVERAVRAADLRPDDVVIEVGPGLGVMTERLVEVSGRVIAVEIDHRLAARLRERFAGVDRLSVVEADAARAAPEEFLEQGGANADAAYVMAGNLPYNAGAAIVRNFLEAQHPPRAMVVMLQREVAENMVAEAGDLGLLGVSVQVYARPKKLFNVPPRAFYPPPKVTSSVVRLDLLPEPLVRPGEREGFFKVLRAGFSAPRKQLRNTLAQGLGMEPADAAAALDSSRIDARRRPQELGVEEWLQLARCIQID
jgi:16S rRNA (adenine1518-N6/adenine1519-N6)-dimethyltransferase